MNVLSMDEKVRIVGALVEGNSIRSIERMTGVHRDTTMRLLIRVGDRCERLLDSSMRGLPCRIVQMDEIWTYVGKKEKRVNVDDDPALVGDQYVFVAMDSETKLIPCFRVGNGRWHLQPCLVARSIVRSGPRKLRQAMKVLSSREALEKFSSWKRSQVSLRLVVVSGLPEMAGSDVSVDFGFHKNIHPPEVRVVLLQDGYVLTQSKLSLFGPEGSHDSRLQFSPHINLFRLHLVTGTIN